MTEMLWHGAAIAPLWCAVVPAAALALMFWRIVVRGEGE